MERWINKVALVTGASVGIGAAVSAALIKHGMTVVGCGRNLEKLEELGETLKDQKGAFHAVQCDVSREDQVVAMFNKIKEDHGGVDVCVNNAGLAFDAPLLTGETEQWRAMLEINVLGVSMCTREAVQSMKERKVDDGHIFNLCSMSGHRVISSKNTHFYAATKHAVNALTQGTRNELVGMKSHIRITQISPGVVETEFFERKSGKKTADKLFKSFKCLEAENVADSVIYAMSAPPHVQVHDILLRPTAQAS